MRMSWLMLNQIKTNETTSHTKMIWKFVFFFFLFSVSFVFNIHLSADLFHIRYTSWTTNGSLSTVWTASRIISKSTWWSSSRVKKKQRRKPFANYFACQSKANKQLQKNSFSISEMSFLSLSLSPYVTIPNSNAT